ncbi:MAG: hypothetical protein AAGC47_11395 [Bacteroidota bacterium]
MKTLKFIFLACTILFALGCTKPADDSPYNTVPKSVTDEKFRIESDRFEIDFEEEVTPAPALINDDEDDETGPNRK